MEKWQCIEKALQELKEKQLYRTMKVIDGPQNSHIIWQGKEMLMLASNAYLDLCNDEVVKAYAKEILMKYGTGSGGSRLTTGTTHLHIELEEELARLKGREAALVFNTGFAANSGIIPAICRVGDFIFSDELNHASIIDGCHMSKAKTIIYKHNDMQDLESKIKISGATSGLIVSDAVFSMDGDIARLPEINKLAKKYNLFSMIDEAHSTGVIGKSGKGIEEYFHVEGQTDILMGTLSKAFGTEGGYVCGAYKLIEYLKNKTRSFIFSTSLSPVTIGATLRGVRLLQEQPERVTKLQENVRYFCKCLNENNINVQSETAIIPIHIGDEGKAVNISEWLMAHGCFISAIRYPTVKKGEAILRVALMSSHTKRELKEAAEKIKEAIEIYN